MFCEKLQFLMEAKNINQSNLSKTTGISKASISQYLSGKNTPRPNSLIVARLADALGCTIDDLFDSPPPDSEKITFNNTMKNIPVSEAAKRMGKSEQFVRVLLQKGIADFGYAVKVTGNKYSYHISPAKFESYLSKM